MSDSEVLMRARGDDIADGGPPPAPTLGEVWSIPKTAKQAKWSVSRMRRYLYARNEELDGGLLVDVGLGKMRPRWAVAVSALRVLHPQWFFDPDALARQLEWMQAGQDDLRVHVLHLSKRIDQLVEQIAIVKKDRNASRERSTGR